MNGHIAVVDVRLDALRVAIASRDWERVEWEYDRVRRAVDKMAAQGAPRSGGPSDESYDPAAHAARMSADIARRTIEPPQAPDSPQASENAPRGQAWLP